MITDTRRASHPRLMTGKTGRLVHVGTRLGCRGLRRYDCYRGLADVR